MDNKAILGLIFAVSITGCTGVNAPISNFNEMYIAPVRMNLHDSQTDAKYVSDATSCLVVQQRDSRSVELYLSAFEDNGSTCYISGVAEIVGKDLVYLDPNFIDGKRGIRIEFGGELIRFRYFPDPNRLTCGEKFDFEKLIFPVSTKLNISTELAPPKNESLSKFCPKVNQ